MWNKIKHYVIFIAIALGVGGLSALLTMGNMDIYEEIARPKLAPPGFLFPIVWTILFILMGISSARIYKSEDSRKNEALFVYFLQLGVNFFWSIFFFNLQAFLLSFIWIIILWLLIIYMIILFYRIDKPAGLLQIPYLVWVTFATYLTYMIYIMN